MPGRPTPDHPGSLEELPTVVTPPGGARTPTPVPVPPPAPPQPFPAPESVTPPLPPPIPPGAVSGPVQILGAALTGVLTVFTG